MKPTPLVAGAAAVVVVVGLHLGARLAGPVLLALVLAVAVSPLSGWLRRHRWPPWLATAVAVATVYGALAGIAATVVLGADRLVALLPEYHDRLAGIQAASAAHGLSSFEPHWRELAAGLWAHILDLVLLLATVLFMVVDASGAPPPGGALRDFARGTRRYLVVTTLFGLAVAAVDTLALWISGVPLPVLWGVLSFVTNYVPNIGFVIGLAPPALLAYLDGGPGRLAAVVAAYCVINFVIQSVVQPKVVGDAVGLSTTVSFLSVVFWAAVLGPLGAFLAVPLTLLAKALLSPQTDEDRPGTAAASCDP